MALASAPTTPDRGIQPPAAIRRAFTAPPKSSRQPIDPLEKQEQNAETLFTHGAARIVSFTAASLSNHRYSVMSDGGATPMEETAGTLPWASHTERTVAAGKHTCGPLRIYRVLSSVAFLSSGNILQPMLPKSQCWCVDGVSKFVLRIRANNYYRIELPLTTQEDSARVDLLRDTLRKVLQYERTPCPFKRGFTVDLPEPPKTPVKMVPWRPKRDHRPTHTSQHSSFEEAIVCEIETLDESKLERIVNTGGVEVPSSLCPSRKVADIPSSETSTDQEDEKHNPKKKYSPLNDSLESELGAPMPIHVLMPSGRTKIERTTTAPPNLARQHRSSTTSLTALSSLKPDSHSFRSSVESFHSFHTPVSSRPSSPVLPELSIDEEYVVQPGEALDDSSEAAVVTSSSPLWDLSDADSSPPDRSKSTPTIASDTATHNDSWEEVKTPSPPGLRLRRTLEKRRTQSPLPSSANLYPPFSPPRSVSRTRFTNALMQRTCTFLIGPSLQLVALMIRIAVRLARSALQGTPFGYGERGEKLPCSWDFSSDGSDASEDGWDEDDYGVKLGKTIPGKEVNAGGSWELD